jgi:Na+/melibiose symporter-like transporter
MVCLLGAYIWLKLDPAVQRGVEWAGFVQFMFGFCSGILLIPLGTLCGIISLFKRQHEKVTSIIGIALNSACFMLYIALRLRWI